MSQDCLFCKIVKREIKSELLFEDKDCVAFKDINPQAPTHILIIPKKHIEKISDMNQEDKSLIGHLQWSGREIAKKVGLKDFRIVLNNGESAGQTVWHLHYHLLGGRPFKWPPG